MDNATTELVKDRLMKEDASFRDLVNQHQKYEERLNILTSLHYPSEEEQEEESVLKKKKLAVKDEIYDMISRHSQQSAVGH
jgi:uncharacterized protein YdcH (DUF465 family)